MRSKSDKYLKGAAALKALVKAKETLGKAPKKSQLDDYTLYKNLMVAGKPSSTICPLRVKIKGRQVLQKAIFDLKTRAKETHRPIDMNKVYRRL